MNHLLFNQQIWEKAWEQDPNTSLKRMKKAGLPTYESQGFSKWAKAYNETSFSMQGQNRSARIMKWIEQQVSSFEGMSILDIGAASGVFSIPFAQKGARVTAVEPSKELTDMLKNNASTHSVEISILNKPFEAIADKPTASFDLVFASMCPAITDWTAAQKAMSFAKKYFYSSMMAGPKRNYLMEEILSALGIENEPVHSSDMAYLLHLLYLEGYTYQSLIEKHEQTTMMRLEEIISQLPTWFRDYGIDADSDLMAKAEKYLRDSSKKEWSVLTGGKFGKVLVYLDN
ncbi:class I SAM-dependent methyltransferase [Planococcus shixiaomingii]|uniref:class I SAM-dependent methyltransferase n=1 Tax=Planococcus shixiaomingii TaxID=3058393 RepID=UPI002602D52D|nr:class I SAM-dependent methyltransferase [Planococcus sp. N022]WKA56544.1 class I SAM-dependent methyltransferase [Planococcus sp. N022]